MCYSMNICFEILQVQRMLVVNSTEQKNKSNNKNRTFQLFWKQSKADSIQKSWRNSQAMQVKKCCQRSTALCELIGYRQVEPRVKPLLGWPVLSSNEWTSETELVDPPVPHELDCINWWLVVAFIHYDRLVATVISFISCLYYSTFILGWSCFFFFFKESVIQTRTHFSFKHALPTWC